MTPTRMGQPATPTPSRKRVELSPTRSRRRSCAHGSASSTRRRRSSPAYFPLSPSLRPRFALASLAGWLGYQVHEDRRAVAERELFVSAARQAVLNLTTIDHTTIDADVQRVLDSTTGAFHDDFKSRAEPFAEVVKQAQSKSEGAVANAAVASEDGDVAQVVMTVSVKMSNAGAQEQQPRSWRMRIEVQKTGDSAKASNVQFVS